MDNQNRVHQGLCIVDVSTMMKIFLCVCEILDFSWKRKYSGSILLIDLMISDAILLLSQCIDACLLQNYAFCALKPSSTELFTHIMLHMSDSHPKSFIAVINLCSHSGFKKKLGITF